MVVRHLPQMGNLVTIVVNPTAAASGLLQSYHQTIAASAGAMCVGPEVFQERVITKRERAKGIWHRVTALS